MSDIAHNDGSTRRAIKSDRFVLWPLIVILLVTAALSVVVGFFPLFLFGLVLYSTTYFWLIGLLLLSVGIATTAIAVAAARRKTWRRAVSLALLPIVMVGVTLDFTGFAHLCSGLGGRAHFYLQRSEYLKEVTAARIPGQPVLMVWNWGGMLWSSSGVVYDESDEIALPPEQQSAAWKNRVSRSGGELVCGDYGFEPLGSHFYLAYFPC